jgi:hypothetical protein
VLEVGAELARHPRVNRVEFRNDTGSWNTAAQYPDGLYLGVSYRSAEGDAWKLDIWFVDEPERQPDLAHMRWIPGVLTQDAREAILVIKSAWIERGVYGKGVWSFDVYSAVLTDGIRTPQEFEAWLTARGKA